MNSLKEYSWLQYKLNLINSTSGKMLITKKIKNNLGYNEALTSEVNGVRFNSIAKIRKQCVKMILVWKHHLLCLKIYLVLHLCHLKLYNSKWL